MVTGGAAGIGAELARQLSAAGAVVVVADRDGDAAQTLADELGKGGARCERAGWMFRGLPRSSRPSRRRSANLGGSI